MLNSVKKIINCSNENYFKGYRKIFRTIYKYKNKGLNIYIYIYIYI
jgi:hypothetical protein